MTTLKNLLKDWHERLPVANRCFVKNWVHWLIEHSTSYPNKEEVKTIPCVFVSRISKSNILAKFKSLQILKKRKTLER